MISKKALALADKELAQMRLREIFGYQDRPTVYTILRHVSASGMSRDISLKTLQDGQLIDITFTAAEALGEKVKEKNGHRVIRVGGCGMDMGFHLVYNLSYAVYREKDASAFDNGGYAIKQVWA